MNRYLTIRRSIAFFKLVAVNRPGGGNSAVKFYNEFTEGIRKVNLADGHKQTVMDLLKNDIDHYGRCA